MLTFLIVGARSNVGRIAKSPWFGRTVKPSNPSLKTAASLPTRSKSLCSRSSMRSLWRGLPEAIIWVLFIATTIPIQIKPACFRQVSLENSHYVF